MALTDILSALADDTSRRILVILRSGSRAAGELAQAMEMPPSRLSYHLAKLKKAELIYRTGEYEEYYMPYYRFYVELPEEERENGLKTYGAYYVPAVESSYIYNMPVWDGSFN